MLKNYLKTAWRNLLRNKTFSLINISGLALGITCSLLIMLWVHDERSVDGFHTNGKQLYQVYVRTYNDGQVGAGYATQGLLAGELKRVIPEVQYASGMEYSSAGTGNTFNVEEKMRRQYGNYVSADFFSMFSYPLLQGTAASALSSPEAVVISRKMAEYFFGGAEQAIGKTMRYDDKEDLKVTAVFENLPANSSQQFDFLRSWIAFVRDNQWVNNWGNTSPATIIQLRAGASPAKVQANIKDFIYRYTPKDNSFRMELDIQPFTDKYLHSTFKAGVPTGGRIEYVRLFTVVAIFILLIACINFMNLATARSTQRAKEVGVRKVIGAARPALIKQFTGEAMLLTFLAVGVAVFLVSLLLPAFNALTGKQLILPVTQPVFWLLLFGLMLLTGFVAGSYPALFLSSLNPVKVLKSRLKFSWGALFFRKGLVVFQFTLSVILIVGTIVVYRQMEYIHNSNIGYDRENLLYLPIEGDLVKKYDLFKKEASKLPGVMVISKMRNSPTVIEHHTGSISWPGKDPNSTISFADGVVGYDYVKALNLKLKEGRDFSPGYGTDSTAYLLNETAVARMGLKDPIGKTVSWGRHDGTVIGVLKDFHFNSMHQTIEPLIIRLDENWGWGTIMVRTQPGKTKEAISGLEKLCRQLNPKVPFTYQFSDQAYTNLYKSEEVVNKLSNAFAVLAIFISCLGLFGLAAFAAGQRTKEIGVRKVLGASVPNIITLLSTSFLKLVILALLIAIPVAWYAMNQWLQDFAYKVDIDWWIFALAGLLTLCIALLTVGYQSIKSALMNPVKSLRSE